MGRGRTPTTRKEYIAERSLYQRHSSSIVHSRSVDIVAMTNGMWLAPIIVICLWYTIVNLDGSGLSMWKYWKANSVEGVRKIWPMPSFYAMKLIITFAVFEALLQMYVPGKRHISIVSPSGNRAIYKKNGFRCCTITLFVFYFVYKEKYFAPAGVYDHLGEIYSSLIIIGSITVSLLFLKGYTYPSSSDWGSTENALVDIYWWEQKGRVADSMVVTSVLMLSYLLKFFWWEGGYLNTLNMMHNRAGYYSIWGSMVWVPAAYSSPALYLVNHPVQLGNYVALFILFGGLSCIYTQYSIDHQRQEFRESHGKAKVWGIVPTKIQAEYVTQKGHRKQNILLASGWWGLARHIHYIFEIGAYFFWSVPALFSHVHEILGSVQEKGAK